MTMTISESVHAQLADAARRGAAHAYCPYSHFRVGAAVLTDDGRISWGSNVENASYGLTICAERNSVFQAVAQSAGPTVIRAVVIYTPTPEPTAPCGACRQVINEFGPDAEVRSICDGPRELRFRLSELLPAAFGPGNLSPDGLTS
jgi:cytidine deaminase